MKTLFLSAAAVAVLALSSATASAQYPIQQAGGCVSCPSGHFGGHACAKSSGWFSGWFSGKHFGGGLFHGVFCNHGSLLGKGGHGGGGLFGPGGPPIPVVDPRGGNAGQLVFPQHPFVRGPRDYFMLEDR